MGNIVTQTDFAARYGVSNATVWNWMRAGMPRAPNGKLDMPECDDWVRKHRPSRKIVIPDEKMRYLRQGRLYKDTTKTDGVLPEALDNPPDNRPIITRPMVEVQREIAETKLQKEQISLSLLKGETLKKADVQQFLQARARQEVDKHIAWLMRLSGLVASEFKLDQSKVYAFLNEQLRNHLRQIAEMPLDKKYLETSDDPSD